MLPELIFKTLKNRSAKPFIIPYRIKQTKIKGNTMKYHLTSDEFKLELTLVKSKFTYYKKFLF